MRLPPKTGLFITGTDTGVGKTLVASAIAHILSQAGHRVGVFKPIATGCHPEKGRLVSTDAKCLAKFASTQFPLNIINPVTYATPAAPIICATLENHPVDYGRIEDAYLQICEVCDFVIVEGIGGIRVPLSPNVDVLEIADQFGLPIVVVARATLGTINHTLLTVDAIRINRLPFAGVVISGLNPNSADPSEKTAPATIARVGDINMIATIPFDPDSSVEAATLGHTTLDALSPVPWLTLAVAQQ